MAFSFSDEQETFRDVVRRFLDDHSPPAEVRRLMETDDGYATATWTTLAEDLGLTGLTIPERYGGQGFGDVELGIVMEEMGRALLCAPYFSSVVLGASALIECGSEADKEQFLPALAAGKQLATLALAEASGSWDPCDVEMTAVPAGDNANLSGTKRFVVDGTIADTVFVAAREPESRGLDGLSLFAVERDAPGLAVRAVETIDPTRKLAELTFNAVAARRVGAAGEAGPGLARALSRAQIALANESVGGAQKMFDSAHEYTLMRVQFGRLIGSFQAIKHTCAELLLDVELAKSAAYFAAQSAAIADADTAALASVAKASASETFMRSAVTCIQLHGGIGFTWEQDTHLWFKRAKASEVMLGTPAFHREQMMRHWA